MTKRIRKGKNEWKKTKINTLKLIQKEDCTYNINEGKCEKSIRLTDTNASWNPK